MNAFPSNRNLLQSVTPPASPPFPDWLASLQNQKKTALASIYIHIFKKKGKATSKQRDGWPTARGPDPQNKSQLPEDPIRPVAAGPHREYEHQDTGAGQDQSTG